MSNTFALRQIARVKNNLGTITPKQADRCYRVHNEQTGCDQWQVQSESDESLDYTVSWDKKFGYRCTCRSGQKGFANVKHASGVCKHVRWSIKAAQAERDLQVQDEKADAEKAEQMRRLFAVDQAKRMQWMLTAPVASHMRQAPREV
jgi:hypothetical protein